MIARRIGAAAFAVWLAALPGRAKAELHRPRMAVLALKPEGVDPALASTVSDALTEDLGRGGHYDVLGRSELEAMAGFTAERQKLGCEGDAGCLAELGGALGAQWLVAGSLGRVGKSYVLSVRLLQIEKARVAGRDTEEVYSQEALLPAADRAAQVLLGENPAPLSATTAGQRRGGPPAWLGYGLLGAGAVAAAVGALFGQQASSDYYSRNPALAGPGVSAQNTANTLFVTGGVLAAAGLGLLIYGALAGGGS